MRKAVLWLSTLLYLSLLPISAQEIPEAEAGSSSGDSNGDQLLEVFFPVDGISQWQKNFDISELDAGYTISSSAPGTPREISSKPSRLISGSIRIPICRFPP
jgi:hypothetical protein